METVGVIGVPLEGSGISRKEDDPPSMPHKAVLFHGAGHTRFCLSVGLEGLQLNDRASIMLRHGGRVAVISNDPTKTGRALPAFRYVPAVTRVRKNSEARALFRQLRVRKRDVSAVR